MPGPHVRLKPRGAYRRLFSHSRQNAGIANKLFDALQSRQVKPWLDQRDLDAGADWNQQVASAIRGADAIVFF